MSELELLAPAGDFDCLTSAIKYGADAIYLGGKMFGMRVVAANFDFDLLEKSVKLAHNCGVKIYLTCNTIPSNSDFFYLKEFLQNAQEIGVDGLIVADLGVVFEARKVVPMLKLHISTQFGVTNFKTANALFELGARRVVLARELSLDEIKKIRQNTPKELELECFVHGAMCVSFSGRCLISQYLLGRDANKGQCAQPCRWVYGLIEKTQSDEVFEVVETEKGSYILNSKDLCLINRLQVLQKAGVNSFKIEGRAKSAYYVAVTTNAYRVAVDEVLSLESGQDFKVASWVLEELEKISHRPYCEGFLFEDPQKATTQNQYYSTGGYIRNCDVVAKVEDVCDDGMLFCVQKNKFCVGDELELILAHREPVKFSVDSLFDERMTKINCASHAEMKVFIRTGFNIESFGVLRGCFLRRNF